MLRVGGRGAGCRDAVAIHSHARVASLRLERITSREAIVPAHLCVVAGRRTPQLRPRPQGTGSPLDSLRQGGPSQGGARCRLVPVDCGELSPGSRGLAARTCHVTTSKGGQHQGGLDRSISGTESRTPTANQGPRRWTCGRRGASRGQRRRPRLVGGNWLRTTHRHWSPAEPWAVMAPAGRVVLMLVPSYPPGLTRDSFGLGVH